MPLNQWTHIAITWNRRNKAFNLYINAVLKKNLVSSLANVNLFDTGLPAIQLGATNGARFFNGFLSDVVILDSVLNQQDINDLKGTFLF